MSFGMMIAGLGGQGAQLLAKCLGLAAALEAQEAYLSSEVGGEMRGGRSLATVTIGPGATRSLPVVPEVAGAVALSPALWSTVVEHIRAGGLVVLDSSVGDWASLHCAGRVVDLPAAQIAEEVGAPMATGFVHLAAFNTLAGLVGLDSLVAAMRTLVPPYRVQHLEANERALRAGAQQAAALPEYACLAATTGGKRP